MAQIDERDGRDGKDQKESTGQPIRLQPASHHARRRPEERGLYHEQHACLSDGAKPEPPAQLHQRAPGHCLQRRVQVTERPRPVLAETIELVEVGVAGEGREHGQQKASQAQIGDPSCLPLLERGMPVGPADDREQPDYQTKLGHVSPWQRQRQLQGNIGVERLDQDGNRDEEQYRDCRDQSVRTGKHSCAFLGRRQPVQRRRLS
jgi:hypothetical protein